MSISYQLLGKMLDFVVLKMLCARFCRCFALAVTSSNLAYRLKAVRIFALLSLKLFGFSQNFYSLPATTLPFALPFCSNLRVPLALLASLYRKFHHSFLELTSFRFVFYICFCKCFTILLSRFNYYFKVLFIFLFLQTTELL